MSDPFWLPEAARLCPREAAEVQRLQEALQALPRTATTGQFVDLYEQMLGARDRLYEAWLAAELATIGPELEAVITDPEGPLLIEPRR